MKRLSIVLACLLLSSASFGKVVSSDCAKTVAMKYLGTSSLIYAGEDGGRATRSNDQDPAYRVYQGPQGWVIVAGDDVAMPILARGDGQFPGGYQMPDNMRAYLGQLADQIYATRTRGVTQDSETKRMWDNVGSPMSRANGFAVKGPLTGHIKWSQNAPFNGKCPQVNGKTCVVGCVATAMSITMRYHEWPASGTGTTSSQSKTDYSIPSINLTNYTYDWNNMPFTSGDCKTQAQKDAVATLCYHVGAAVKMSYGVGASAAYMDYVAPAFYNNFKYKKSAILLTWQDYTYEEWFDLVKREIDAGRPLVYGADAGNGSGGHCMVCDGYDESTRMVSANWGWGSGSCWVVLNTMNGVSKGWPTGHQAVFGLEPDTDGNSKSTDVVYFYGSTTDNTLYGLHLADNVTGIRRDGRFNAEMFMRVKTTGSYNYKFVLADVDNNIKETVSDEGVWNFTSGTMKKTVECQIKGNAVIGDRVRCYTNRNNSPDWYLVGRYYWPLAASTIAALPRETMTEFGAYDIDLISFPTVLVSGMIYQPIVLYGGHYSYKTVTYYLDGEEIDKKHPSVQVTSGEHTIMAKMTYCDGATKTIVAHVNILADAPWAPKANTTGLQTIPGTNL